MLQQSLSKLKHAYIKDVLTELARVGLTLEDCRLFFAKHRSEDDLYAVKKAQEEFHEEGVLEVDDTAEVSVGDMYTYVSAWVRVRNEMFREKGKEEK